MAFQDGNKAGRIRHQNMTSLSAWPVAKVDVWGSAGLVSSGAGNFADWDWLSLGLLNYPPLFRPVFLVFTAFLDVYFIIIKRFIDIIHCVTDSSGSTS